MDNGGWKREGERERTKSEWARSKLKKNYTQAVAKTERELKREHKKGRQTERNLYGDISTGKCLLILLGVVVKLI